MAQRLRALAALAEPAAQLTTVYNSVPEGEARSFNFDGHCVPRHASSLTPRQLKINSLLKREKRNSDLLK